MADDDLGKAVKILDKELDSLIERKERLAKDLDAIKSIDKKIVSLLPKPDDFTSEEIDIKTRDILLKYYSSECTTHGTYILSAALGAFAFFQVADKINGINFLSYNVGFILNGLIVSGFLTISILFIARTIYWGALTSIVTHIRELTAEQTEKTIDITRDKITFLLRLHRACIEFYKKSHPTLNHLVGVDRKTQMRRLYVIIFVFFTGLFLTVNIIIQLIH
jgi:hypothetical protein